VHQVAVEPVDAGRPGAEETQGAGRNRFEDRLEFRSSLADCAEDLGDGRLPFERFRQVAIARLPSLSQFAVERLELPQRLRLVPKRLRQALLKVADQSGIVLGRPADTTGLGLNLILRWLWTPTHRPPFASL
jgi:hypothetical protein